MKVGDLVLWTHVSHSGISARIGMVIDDIASAYFGHVVVRVIIGKQIFLARLDELEVIT